MIESLKNIPENYILIDEGDISNYIGVNIKTHSDGAFNLLQSQIVEKIVNHVRHTVSAILNAIEITTIKPLLYQYYYSQERKCVWNYRAEVGMLIYLQVSTQPEISMLVHQCELFLNNPCLLHKQNGRRIVK